MAGRGVCGRCLRGPWRRRADTSPAHPRRPSAQVLAIQLQDVESVQEGVLRAGRQGRAQPVEIRHALGVSGDDLAINSHRADWHRAQGVGEVRQPLGPINAAPGEQANAITVPPRDQAAAVVLDLMHPQLAYGDALGGCWQARFDIASEGAGTHTRQRHGLQNMQPRAGVESMSLIPAPCSSHPASRARLPDHAAEALR